MERIEMSVQEVKRLEVLRQVSDGVLTQRMAAEYLRAEGRQVSKADQRIELLHGEEVLPYKVFDPTQAPTPPVDDKTLNARVDDVLKARRWSEKSRPGPNHPWRRYPAPPPSGGGQSPPPESKTQSATGHLYLAQLPDISTLP